jgi:hypothetical protein
VIRRNCCAPGRRADDSPVLGSSCWFAVNELDALGRHRRLAGRFGVPETLRGTGV